VLVPKFNVPSSAIPTADPRPLFYVVATVFGVLALWVLYTLATAETRKPPPSPKPSDDAAK
jgi:hypothetical protein